MNIDFLRKTAKAGVALVVCAAAYLVGILSGNQTLADVTTVQWLGLVVFMGGAYGITYAVPNKRSTRTPRVRGGKHRA